MGSRLILTPVLSPNPWTGLVKMPLQFGRPFKSWEDCNHFAEEERQDMRRLHEQIPDGPMRSGMGWPPAADDDRLGEQNITSTMQDLPQSRPHELEANSLVEA